MTAGVFVAGTGTEIGKTAVSGGLAGALARRGHDVGAVKPVQTGCLREDGLVAQDARFLRRAAGIEAEEVCPFLLEPALAPRVAAEIEGRELRYRDVLSEVERLVGNHEFTVVEGVGGVRVPLAGDREVIDLMEDLGFPVIVVARSGLGTLNHTALTVEAVRGRGLDVVGVVLNRYPSDPGHAAETNPGEVERMNDVGVLGRVPEIDVDTEAGEVGEVVDAVENNVDLGVVERLIP